MILVRKPSLVTDGIRTLKEWRDWTTVNGGGCAGNGDIWLHVWVSDPNDGRAMTCSGCGATMTAGQPWPLR